MASRAIHQRNLETHRDTLAELKLALAEIERAISEGDDARLPEVRLVVQRACRTHSDALQAVRGTYAPPQMERLTDEEQAEADQLEEGGRLQAQAMVLLHAWAGATAQEERAAHLAAQLRDSQDALARAQSQAEGSGRSANGQDAGDRAREHQRLPELKVKAFNGIDRGYPVQQFLFLTRHAARATGLDTVLYRVYPSLDLQQIDARTRCMEGAALDWALQHEGKFSELTAWEAALEAEFTALTPAEARAELYRLRYDGQDLAAHDAQFRRLSSLTQGLSEQEAVMAYTHSLGKDLELREQVERAAPATWQEAAKVARREVRILGERRQAKGNQADQSSRARRPEREQLHHIAAGTTDPSTSPELQNLQSDIVSLRETLNLLQQRWQPNRPPLKPEDFGLDPVEFARRRSNRLCYVCGERHCHSSRHPPKGRATAGASQPN